jgi:hypothetical protein
MSKAKNRIIFVLASIGVVALLYGGWRFYEQKVSEDQAHAILNAPPSEPLKQLYRDAPPPPQP